VFGVGLFFFSLSPVVHAGVVVVFTS
jgi:hypothetical protein